MTTESKAPAIEIWDIEKLVPYAKNAKKHPKEQVETLAGLIKQFGWTQPIIVDKDGVIIVGHGRRLAALHLGMSRVPVVCRRDLSKAEAEAMRLADNRAASTDYDTELLQEALQSLAGQFDDLGFMGFEAKELSFLTPEIANIDESLFVEDIIGAVDQQRADNDRRTEEVDKSTAPLSNAFGFNRLTMVQSRRVKGFMTKLEGETGKKGADALMVFLDNMEA